MKNNKVSRDPTLPRERNQLKEWVTTLRDHSALIDATSELVELTEYKDRSSYVAAEWHWVFDYSKDTKWSSKLRCTQVTTKCDGYREPQQTLMEDYTDRPAYADCTCDNVDWNANYGAFGVAFITLIR